MSVLISHLTRHDLGINSFIYLRITFSISKHDLETSPSPTTYSSSLDRLFIGGYPTDVAAFRSSDDLAKDDLFSAWSASTSSLLRQVRDSTTIAS